MSGVATLQRCIHRDANKKRNMGTHWNIEDEGGDAKRVTECQEQDRKKKLWQTARNPICVSGSTGEKNRESNEVGQIYGEEIYIYPSRSDSSAWRGRARSKMRDGEMKLKRNADENRESV